MSMTQEITPVPTAEPTPKAKWRPTSHLSRAEREEMKALSKEVFRSASKWAKLIDNGVVEKVTKLVSEVVPQDDGTPKTIEKKVPVLNEHGAEYSVTKYYTYEELKEQMLDMKVKLAEMRAMFEKQQEEAAKAKADADSAKAVQEAAGGNAI